MNSHECQCAIQRRSQGNKSIQVLFPFQDVLGYTYLSCSHPQRPCSAEQVWSHKEPCQREVPRSPRALTAGCRRRLSRREAEWVAQSPQQHRCASSRAPAVRRRPRRSRGKPSAITQTPSYHCGPVLPSKQAAKFSVFARTPRWILAAATLFLLHHPLWHRPLPCPPPRHPPQEALLYGLTYRLEPSSFLRLTIPLVRGDEYTLSVIFSNKQ